MTLEEVNEKYRNICTILGDIEVKIQGMKNHRDLLFKQLQELDEVARKLGEQSETTPVG